MKLQKWSFQEHKITSAKRPKLIKLTEIKGLQLFQKISCWWGRKASRGPGTSPDNIQPLISLFNWPCPPWVCLFSIHKNKGEKIKSYILML